MLNSYSHAEFLLECCLLTRMFSFLLERVLKSFILNQNGSCDFNSVNQIIFVTASNNVHKAWLVLCVLGIFLRNIPLVRDFFLTYCLIQRNAAMHEAVVSNSVPNQSRNKTYKN